MRTVFTLFAAALAALIGPLACSKLTEPPRPEPVETTAGSADPNQQKLDAVKKTAEAIASASAAQAPTPPANANPNEKLESKDIVVGKGAEAKTGDTVSVHYVGTLQDGKEFDSSKKHGQPFTFELGAGRVIKGWDQGVVGMKVGGKRKLTIPPSLAYGARGFPPVIPPNSTLSFDIELLEVKKK